MAKRDDKTGKGCELFVKRINKDAEIPACSGENNIGVELFSAEDVCFSPGEQKAVKTGIALKIPEGYVGLIRDRAGLVSEMNLHAVAGTIDSSYGKEVSIILINFSGADVEVEKGMKIAQIIIVPVLKIKVKEVKKL